MEKFELLYILPAKYTEAEVGGLKDKIAGIITAAGGTISETHDLGKRRLAYPIKHVRHGHYVLVYLEADSAAINKLNGTFRLSTDLLRHLILKRDPYITKVPVLTDYEEIRTERDELPPRREPVTRPQVAIRKEAAPQITMEDLDKKLDEILTEEVL